MELLGACMLSEGEEIIFDDGNIGRNKRLVSTNKRLIFLQSKGRFNKTYQKEDEIPTEDIESARYETEFGTIVLQLKDGEKDIVDFIESDGFDALMGTNPDVSDVRHRATIDRWLNEVNRLAVKVPKITYCKYCGAKNKPVDAKCVHCGALLS